MLCDRCGQPLDVGEHGQYLCPLEPRATLHAVIDDSLDGGARFFENLGHEPVWVESKSQLQREMDARNLQHGSRHDRQWHDRFRREHMEKLRDEGTIR